MAALGKFLGKVVDKVLASPIGSKSPEIQRAGHIAKRVSDQIVADEGTGAIDVQAARDALRAVGMGGNVGRRIEDIHREALEAAITQTSFLPSSVLFVPLSNLKALRKIPTINADAFILDLEDAVPPNKKDDARNNLVDLCKNGEFANKRLYVRVNSPRITPHIGMQDLDACGIVSKFIHGVCIPKTEHADIDIVDGAMHDETPLWAFIETAVGVQQVERILGSKRFKAVVVGSNDLGTELGLPRLTPAQAQQLPPRFGLQYAQSRIVMAARAAGIPVIDGVFNDHSDMKGLATDCLVGQALGFDGKSLIHPAQVPVCNAAFDPTPEQIAWARKVITAVAVSGGGATVCDGEMVEELHARRAREVLKRADLVASRSIVIESPLKRNREEEEAKMRFLSKVIGEEASAEELLMPAPPGSLNKENNNNKDDNSTRGESEPLRPKSASQELRFIAEEEEVNPNEFQDAGTGTNSAQTGSSSSGGGDAKAADNDDVSSLSSLDRQEARDSRRTPRGAAPKRNGPRNFKLVKEEEFYPNLDDQLHVRFRP